MKTIATTLLMSALASTTLFGAGAAVNALKVSNDINTISYASALWNKATFSPVFLYPQTTIRMNDKKANEMNAHNHAKKAMVAAVYNDHNIAFMIRWPDATINVQKGESTTTYADGFAVQFASRVDDPNKLPYIGMGSQGRPVVVHLQKVAKDIYEPDGHGEVAYQVNRNQTDLFGKALQAFDKKVQSLGSSDYERSFISEGFRSMTEIKDGSNNSYARIRYLKKDHAWEGTLTRALKDEYVNLNAPAIPVAFAVWDGEKMGRDGLKHLSAWVSVKLQGKQGGEALISALDGTLVGDPKAGKRAVAANGCAGCHQMTAEDAPNILGPSLRNIGGYSTAGYLKESLLNPSAAIVPGYNRNAHSAYPWYTVNNGKRVSAMTDYSWLDQKTQNDIVAYLQTLKAEVK
ncbi:MAG: hypothetical protein DSZ03_03325 [Sulfurimonas sp.]|nr:MAG: hypothetical protein DSZ03_03325 [Sulfurimonas sp.]